LVRINATRAFQEFGIQGFGELKFIILAKILEKFLCGCEKAIQIEAE
jgi:hypothetical protein